MAPRKKPAKRSTKQPQQDPRAAKLESLLDDFDDEVNTILGQLKEQKLNLLKDVDNQYNFNIIKLPKAVKKMNWMDYYRMEAPKSPKVDNTNREEEKAGTVDPLLDVDTALLKSVKKASRPQAVLSSEDKSVPGTTKKGRTARKPPVTSKKNRAPSTSKNTLNSSIRKPNRKPLITPARSMLDSSLMMGPTPLITPRFDSRLPKTPAVRVPRHKERVYSISVNGSPIATGTSEDIVINVPIGNGESIQLLASQMDSLDLSSLDETTLSSIRMLQNRLTTLCGPV